MLTHWADVYFIINIKRKRKHTTVVMCVPWHSFVECLEWSLCPFHGSELGARCRTRTILPQGIMLVLLTQFIRGRRQACRNPGMLKSLIPARCDMADNLGHLCRQTMYICRQFYQMTKIICKNGI